MWRKKDQDFRKNTPLQLLNTEGGSIEFWACFVASCMGNISLVDGRMDSIKYQQILGGNITLSVKKAEYEKRGFTTGY